MLVNGLGDWLPMHEVGGGLRGGGSTRPDLGSASLYIPMTSVVVSVAIWAQAGEATDTRFSKEL